MKRISHTTLKVAFGLLAFCVIAGVLAVIVDFTDRPLVGDMASHIAQSLSLAYDGDLKFDEGDAELWKQLEWERFPRGIFYQSYRGGYAMAKPYGYSAFAAPFVRILGHRGFIVANAALFALLVLLCYSTLRRASYSRLTSAALVAGFAFFSHVYMYMFYIHSDLFLATLTALGVYLTLRASDNGRWRDTVFLALALALLVSEKIAAAPVAGALALLYLVRTRNWKLTAVLGGVSIVALFLFCLPYLHYSDFKSWNPYGGARGQGISGAPFFPGYDAGGFVQHTSGAFFSADYILGMFTDWRGLLGRGVPLYQYFFGAYTGMLVYLPLALLVIITGLVRLIRRPSLELACALAGIFGYILFYILLMPNNYYGGGQSIGNRYFLQIAPMVILVLALLRLSPRVSMTMSTTAAVLSLALLHAQHVSPHDAYIYIFKAGPLQRMMPFDSSQGSVIRSLFDDRLVNGRMLPARPAYAFCAEVVETNGRLLAVRENGRPNLLIEVSPETTVWTRIPPIMGIRPPLLLNNAFHTPESEHVWSRQDSEVMVKNDGSRAKIDVKLAFLPHTRVTAVFGDEIVNGTPPFSFEIETAEFEEKWIPVKLHADRSGSPADNGGLDSRKLAFALGL